MKKLAIYIFILCKFSTPVFAQLELKTGYAVNRLLADGIPLSISYEFKVDKRLYTKSEIGYKYLHYYNDFIEANLDFSIIELHQTISYKILNKRDYIFQPNIGINYRWYNIKAEILAPYNTLPQRALIIDRIRGDRIRLNSYDGDGDKLVKRKVSNLGFTIQLQNQFKLKKNLWLSITPFLEPDYDRIQNTGGCYLGIIFKNL